jgi:hypothetical protein
MALMTFHQLLIVAQKIIKPCSKFTKVCIWDILSIPNPYLMFIATKSASSKMMNKIEAKDISFKRRRKKIMHSTFYFHSSFLLLVVTINQSFNRGGKKIVQLTFSLYFYFPSPSNSN